MPAFSFAGIYDVVMTAADRLGLANRRRSLAREARGCVIEIGAGTGLQFAYYPPDAEVYAVEPDLAMIERARARRRDARASIALVAADARALPFRDGAFDTAVAALAFCTIPEPEGAAKEMRRVLRASGSARLLEHVRATHRVLAWPQVALTPVWRRMAGGCHLARRTEDVVRRAGFDVTVEHSALDGAVVELVARPRNLSRRSGGDATAQRTLSAHSGSSVIVR